MTKSLAVVCLLLGSVVSVSAQKQLVTLDGQVVCCADCWAEADRTKVEYGTAENLLKAKSCVERGDPTLLAVREGDRFALYELQLGKFRLPGKNWLDFVGKRVTATGALSRKKEAGVLRVDTLIVTAQSVAEREAARIIGQEIELAIEDLSGAQQRLSSLKGRIVILNFWATYCIPCRQEMPDLAAIQNEYAPQGVQVIGASADLVSDRSKVLEFVRQTKINFPIWLNATTADMVRFGLGPALPGTVVIGKDGRVSKIISGVVNQIDLKKQIEAMLTAAEATRKESAGAQVASIKKPTTQVSSVPS